MNSPMSARLIEIHGHVCFATAGRIALLAGAISFGLSATGDTAEFHSTGTPSFADMVARVKPAVIAVTVKLQETPENVAASEADGSSQTQPYSERSPRFQYFFGSPDQKPQKPPEERLVRALGSGFFI
jgi:serine protease Do